MGEEKIKAARGTIKWFSVEKKFGFIEPDEGNRILFMHESFIAETDLTTFEPGTRVLYEPYEGRKGLEARNVQIIKQEPG